jgi:hypothetical protein
MNEELKNANKKASEMTKREMFAAMAMQGILSSLTEESDISIDTLVKCSFRNADAMLAAIEENTEDIDPRI